MRAKLQIISLTVCNLLWTIPIGAQPTLGFSQLPSEIQNHALEVRKSCWVDEPSGKPVPEPEVNDMRGITVLDLTGDGSRDIFVDNGQLCSSGPAAGFNCTNRTCEFVIYKEGPKGQWRKIFDENLYDKYLAIDQEHGRLQLMVVSIWAGDPRCHRKDVTWMGAQCNLIVTFRNNKWNWQLLH
jgi:hypothetical protein